MMMLTHAEACGVRGCFSTRDSHSIPPHVQKFVTRTAMTMHSLLKNWIIST